MVVWVLPQPPGVIDSGASLGVGKVQLVRVSLHSLDVLWDSGLRIIQFVTRPVRRPSLLDDEHPVAHSKVWLAPSPVSLDGLAFLGLRNSWSGGLLKVMQCLGHLLGLTPRQPLASGREVFQICSQGPVEWRGHWEAKYHFMGGSPPKLSCGHEACTVSSGGKASDQLS